MPDHLNLFQRGWKLFLENEEKAVVVDKREPGKAAVKVTVTLTRKRQDAKAASADAMVKAALAGGKGSDEISF